MASTCMHLYAGRSCLRAAPDRFQIDPAQFYLGCVAPDSVNVDGFAPQADRWAAHMRSADLSVWYGNIRRFWEGQAGCPDRSLLLGYAVHCVTDVAWDADFHEKVWTETARLSLPPMMDKDAGWDDCYRFDHDQFSAPWWTREAAPALRAAKPKPVHTIPADLLERYRLHILERYPGSIAQGGPRCVTPALVDELAGVVLEKCRALLAL